MLPESTDSIINTLINKAYRDMSNKLYYHFINNGLDPNDYEGTPIELRFNPDNTFSLVSTSRKKSNECT